ncbi:stage VI sporulation protein D [Virgibacillus kekensis]|uniref:Stage VI sporulation protein D n=1 Tax=Virgibacillus kekensis TaxID=202261 RepID=A0ABV9DKL8_9BACI
MSNEHEVFTFDLDESLYFEEGQEVAEMMGISLDPEISIQPFNDYISIRGVIELHGTYQKEETVKREESERESFDFDSYHSRRYIERVVELENGLSEFVHRFPVEISVPAYRVADLNDVTVNIESFDYEIPRHNHLKLNSKIEIHGIRDTRGETPVAENHTEESDEFLPSEESKFEFDIKSVKEGEKEDSPESRPEPDYTSLVSLEPDYVDAGEDKEVVKDRWKYKKSQSLAEFFDKKEASVEKSAESQSHEESSHAVEFQGTESDESYEVEESRSEERKDASYLADLFRSEEEDSYAKMKLCIVQEKDTVESIAERYEISPLQLVKQNHLLDESIEEGQLLYIPYKKRN